MFDDISFFMLAYGQLKATEKCLESVRKYYKRSKIIVFENYTNILNDICKKYDAIYIHQPVNYLKQRPELGLNYVCMLDINDFKLFMNQCEKASSLTNTKWLLYLEPDCILRRKIEYFPEKSIGGHLHTFNNFNQDIVQSINYFRKNNKKNSYIFSCAGGSILNRKHLLQVCKANWEKYIEYAIQINKNTNYPCEIRCLDAALSYLFYIQEFEAEDWQELTETQHSNLYRATTAAIVHDFKYFYE